MKSTTFDTTNSQAVSAFWHAHSDRWKALPFLILMMSSGLPLNYTLEQARPMTVADVAEQTLEAASSAGSPSSVSFALFIGSLYLFGTWIMFRKPKVVMAILTRQWPLLFLMLYVAASVLWSFNPDKVISNSVHNFGASCICIAAALRYRHDPWLFPKHLGYILGVNMVLQLAAVLLIPSYAIDWQGRWHGLTPHPNTFGAMALTTLWSNTAILLCRKDDKRHFHLIFSALAIVAMIGADSVTSMISSACVVLAMVALKTLEKMNAGKKFYISVLAISTIVALAVLIVGSAFDLSGLFGLFGRDPNLTGRTSVWELAFSDISKYPILGWSFDDHTYLIATQGNAYASYHNGFLDIAVSGGAISILLLVLLLGTWIANFTKRSLIASEIIPFSASFGIAYIVHNMTESSLISPRGQMWLIFLVLVCLGACRKQQASNVDAGVVTVGSRQHQIQNPMQAAA